MDNIFIKKRDGREELLDIEKMRKVIRWAIDGIDNVSLSQIEMKSRIQFADKMKSEDIQKILIKTAADLISKDTPNYSIVAARLNMFDLRKRAYGQFDPPKLYDHVVKMVKLGKYDKKLLEYYTEEEFNEMDKFIDHSRDLYFHYAAVKQLEGKYLVQNRTTGEVYESPQMAYILISAIFFQRYSKDKRLGLVKEFYDYLSTGVISLPTPIMGGLRTPTRQFSSCVLIECGDTLNSINATASAIVKYVSQRAGIGINAGAIRALGSPIRGGEAFHTGCIPFYKYFQSAVKSCSQGGLRGGAATLYYPIWHYEFPELIVLKNNRGVEDNRVRHMDYGVQISKLFYERLIKGENITLFSPSEVPELYKTFFTNPIKFEELYVKAENNPKIRKRVIKAVDIFSSIMQERASTGRIYIQNIDHCNTHSAFNPELAPVKQSNLCCFTGDTVIATADGRNGVTISELAKETLDGKPIYVYSAKEGVSRRIGNRNGGALVTSPWSPEIKKAIAFKTGEKEVIKVTLSDGSSFKCTPDHLLATIDGDWIRADESLNLELESLYTYTPTYKQTQYRHINSISNGYSKQHRLIWSYFNGNIEKGYHVDHIVDGKGDNISNLQLLYKNDHYKKTFSKFEKDNPVSRMDSKHRIELARSKALGPANNRFSGYDNFELIKLVQDEMALTGQPAKVCYSNLRNKLGLPKTFSRYRFGGNWDLFWDYCNGNKIYKGEFEPIVKSNEEIRLSSISTEDKLNLDYQNSRIDYIKSTFYEDIDESLTRRKGLSVVSIEKLGVESVYDLEVDDNHNFYILTKTDDSEFKNASGVLVHNCEITLPTKPLNNISDQNGEIALCTLSAINLGKIDRLGDMERPLELIVRALDELLDYQDYPVKAAEVWGLARRSLGVGVINYAYYLAKNGAKYGDEKGLELTHETFEAFQYYLLKASNKLAKEVGKCKAFDQTTYSQGILPIDTYKKDLDQVCNIKLLYDWENLRKEIKEHGLRNSTLSAIAPTETSSQVSNATNGIEPPRDFISIKASKDGILKQVVPEYERLKDNYQLLWSIKDNKSILNSVAVMQKFVDQTISTNTNYDPKNYEGEKVPMKLLLSDLLYAYKMGIKTFYYHNTRDGASDKQEDIEDECTSCKI